MVETNTDSATPAKNEDFSKHLVKEYKYWDVYVNQNQGYLGRCIIWCKRETALDLIHATKAEQNEFFHILKRLVKATTNAFHSDWYNYAFLGNETRHLHCHFIPRYSSPRTFQGMIFEDKLWGRNYQTNKNFITPPEILEIIRLKLIDELAFM